MGKHRTPDRHAPRNSSAIRNVALALIGLTVVVVAMIASYSGAFAKPTLHHMAVAVAAPEHVVDGIRGQDALAVTEVGDAAAARQQVYERKTDAAFVVAPGGEMTIYVAGGGGHSVAAAAGPVGRRLLSGFYSTFTAIVPQGSGVSLLRSVEYFGGNGAQTPLVTLAIWGAAGCLLAIAAAAVRVNYRSLYERFARRNRTVLRPRLLSPAD
jgi:hypothetical protein